MKRALQAIGLLVLLGAVATVIPGAWVHFRYQRLIYTQADQVPPAPVAIVFGAAVRPNGEPSWMLADRVDAAVQLFKANKVQRVLMSGDGSGPYYDEVTAMKQHAIEQGVPADNIIVDPAGLRTYDSCYRAKEVFGIDQAILVTQGYHLPRALYLANSFGIKAVGLKAGLDHYAQQDYYDLREAAASILTWYEVHVTHPLPRFLGALVGLDTQTD